MGWTPPWKGSNEEAPPKKDREKVDAEEGEKDQIPPREASYGRAGPEGTEGTSGEHDETTERMEPNAMSGDLTGDGPNQESRERHILQSIKSQEEPKDQGLRELHRNKFIKALFSDIHNAMRDIQVIIDGDEKLAKSSTVRVVMDRINWDIDDLEMWVVKSRPLPSDEVKLEIVRRKLGKKKSPTKEKP